MDENAWEGPLQEFGHAELGSNTCIRLVQIHTELFRGDISCTLQQYESDTGTCPDYAALSYVWGDPTPTHTIYINKRVYRVHKSLWEFLSHSRTKEDAEHTWFWTDLLCIDQAHHNEKNEQISRMGDIYAQAAYVISWLGAHGKTAEALRTLIEITEDIDTECTPKYERNSSESKRIHRVCDQLTLYEPYWGRVWVFQEVACARNCIVVCGYTSVNLEDLQHKIEIAMSFVHFHAADRLFRMERIGVHADLKISIRQGKTIKFLELIDKTVGCEATRKQDRIYGLLGLAGRLDPGFDSRVLEVSQQKKLADVWWDVVFMILDQESNLNIKRQLETLEKFSGRGLPPPRKHSELEMGWSSRRAHAETASQVSEAAFSWRTQDFLGVNYPTSGYIAETEGKPWLRVRTVWRTVTTHIYRHDHNVPGLQTTLGWSTYAGLRFTSWHDTTERTSWALTNFLPVGWLCAAHSPDSLTRTIEKHRILGTGSIIVPPQHRFRPRYCSGAEGNETQCDLSLAMLKIEQLGVTCLVRSTDTVEIDFYCDCCDSRNPPFRGYA